MGGLSFLQKITGRTSSKQVKEVAIKEAEEIIKLKQQNEDLKAQVSKATADLSKVTADLSKFKADLSKATADVSRVNAELKKEKDTAKVCPMPPPCPPPDLSRIQLKDIPNVGDKFKIWLRSLPATTADRKKIVDYVNTLPESQRELALPSE